MVRTHEHVKILFLKLLGDLDSYLLGWRGPENGRKAWSGAVNEFHSTLAQYYVIRRT
jgi:hypothetical protein